MTLRLSTHKPVSVFDELTDGLMFNLASNNLKGSLLGTMKPADKWVRKLFRLSVQASGLYTLPTVVLLTRFAELSFSTFYTQAVRVYARALRSQCEHFYRCFVRFYTRYPQDQQKLQTFLNYFNTLLDKHLIGGLVEGKL